MKNIVLIIPYFGKWPFWFDAYLLSIAKNPDVNWLFITDCEIPKEYPENSRFIPTTLQDLNKRINTILNVQVPLTPRKLCDIRPAYAKVFEEYIVEFDFWGFCDVDIIWGNIRGFITEDMLANYDIISSRKEAISGHFTLFKNVTKTNEFYKTVPDYKNQFKLEHVNFDEYQLTKHINNLNNLGKNPFKIYWPKILLNQERGIDSHQEYYLDKWQWVNGKMVDTQTGKEHMYLHFINWKRTMKTCKVAYQDNPTQFYISYNGIHYKKHAKFNHLFNTFKNKFNGYWVREKRRYRKIKFKSLSKRLKRKWNLII